MENAAVSVIIRSAGQRPSLLLRALDSVARQTFSNIEIIVVEDGGDAMRSLLAQWRQTSNMRLTYESIPKGGRSKAGNHALALAKGESVCFLDDDDVLLPSHFSVLVPLLNAHPQVPAVYALSWERISYLGGLVRRRRIAGHHPYIQSRLLMANHIPIQAVLARRAAILKAGGFDESLEALEDWDLWLRLSFMGDFVSTEAVTSEFFVSGGRKARERRLAEHGRAFETIRAKYPNIAIGVPPNEISPELEMQMKSLREDPIWPRRMLRKLIGW